MVFISPGPPVPSPEGAADRRSSAPVHVAMAPASHQPCGSVSAATPCPLPRFRAVASPDRPPTAAIPLPDLLLTPHTRTRHSQICSRLPHAPPPQPGPSAHTPGPHLPPPPPPPRSPAAHLVRSEPPTQRPCPSRGQPDLLVRQTLGAGSPGLHLPLSVPVTLSQSGAPQGPPSSSAQQATCPAGGRWGLGEEAVRRKTLFSGTLSCTHVHFLPSFRFPRQGP